jgi:uncharacterized protein (DUF2461 family)
MTMMPLFLPPPSGSAGVVRPVSRHGTIPHGLTATPAAWKRATETPAMKGLVWWGDSLSRTPRGFPDDHALVDMLKRKDFAAGVELGRRDALAPGFLDRCAEVYRALAPTMKLLARAQGLAW